MKQQDPVILCLAHLSWDFVWQRPQHILSRLAQQYELLYINEPHLHPHEQQPALKRVAQEPNLSAWQPLFPDNERTHRCWREQYLELIRELLLRKEWIEEQGGKLVATRPIILWFYTPIPFYALDHLPASVVVYDVMDELANFKGGAEDMREREARLLNQADVVFTGGPSLYAARRERHPNIHLFPSGVEPDHFAQALSGDTEVAEQIAALPRPILGYFGVIDERMDLGLLRDLAERRPESSIVMVGPVAKIEESLLPRLPNIHYTGKQPYERLPNFLKGFDLCLMPFALNDATRYISPTKTLEYMAAHKPIVSTPVPDVVSKWSGIVRIAATPDAFANAVEQALNESEAERATRIAREKEALARHTWDYIAGEMARLIEEVL